ncbi:hypothetical protein LCGC14_0791960 [marine sediment metagenome]|uniref:Uncharacterized protein n=1 Tax=marine sediment metagenome TaxID=412755 RepID=A0A0F9SC74_9ZZZZ
MRDKERRSSKKFKNKERKKFPYKKTRKEKIVPPIK